MRSPFLGGRRRGGAFVPYLVRRQIYFRDNYTCHYCVRRCVFNAAERLANPGLGATLDHKKPRSKGGWSSVKNLVTACDDCNNEKGDLEYEVYLWYRYMVEIGYDRRDVFAAVEAFNPENYPWTLVLPAEAAYVAGHEPSKDIDENDHRQQAFKTLTAGAPMGADLDR